MHYKEIIDTLRELTKLVAPAGAVIILLRLMKYINTYIHRKRPVESSKKFDTNGNLTEIIKKFRD